MSVSVANPRILLLGGHGKVSLLMTPRLLSRGWSVISVIRDPAQEPDIKQAAAVSGAKGQLNVLVHSLDDISTEAHAKQVLDKVKPDWVIWSAGAGGKGGPSRTHAIDNVAASAFARAAAANNSITAFLIISAISSRRKRAPWWSDSVWQHFENINTEVLPAYYKAKVAADECLTAVAHRRNTAQSATPLAAVSLRPGTLSDSEATGKVELGKTNGVQSVPRADVAETAVRLLEEVQKGWTGGWVDLLGGEEDIGSAIRRWVDSGEDAIEGEDVETIYKAGAQEVVA